MPDVVNLTWGQTYQLVDKMGHLILEELKPQAPLRVWGVPRGGTFVAGLLNCRLGEWFHAVDSDLNADLLVDDLVDSGRTQRLWSARRPNAWFATLLNKSDSAWHSKWISFPWERAVNEATGVEDSVVRMLQYIGEDPNRSGLLETPARVVRAWNEMFAGYKEDPSKLFKVFDDTSDEMVICRNIEFCSFCEHHLLPFTGRAHVAYIPNGRVIGLSKLARLVDLYARRLQVQERLTSQITAALDQYLSPLGSACIIEAEHHCMRCRGVGKQHSSMITSSLTGVMREQATRSEFLSLVQGTVR